MDLRVLCGFSPIGLSRKENATVEKSVMIYDGDRLVMELIATSERNYTLYSIKKNDTRRALSRRTFFAYLEIAKRAGYELRGCTDF